MAFRAQEKVTARAGGHEFDIAAVGAFKEVVHVLPFLVLVSFLPYVPSEEHPPSLFQRVSTSVATRIPNYELSLARAKYRWVLTKTQGIGKLHAWGNIYFIVLASPGLCFPMIPI